MDASRIGSVAAPSRWLLGVRRRTEAGQHDDFTNLITTLGVASLTRTRNFVADVCLRLSRSPIRTTASRYFDRLRLPNYRTIRSQRSRIVPFALLRKRIRLFPPS